MKTTSERSSAVFAFVGDVSRSSRALRQIRALREIDVRIQVLHLAPEKPGGELAKGLPISENLTITQLAPSRRSGPLFFMEAHTLIRKAALRTKADVFIASDLYSLPAMSTAADKHGGALVYDSRELYAHLDSSAGRPWVRAFWRTVERRFIGRAHLVFTVNRSIADRLASDYGIDPPVVLDNVSESVGVEKSTKLRDEFGIPPGQRIVLYQGGLREGRGLPQLIRAVGKVSTAHLVLIGDGPFETEARRLAESLGSRVSFKRFTPPDDLLSWSASADLGVVLIEPLTESLRLALPNKLFEYLAAGLPVLASPIPEMAAVLTRFNVGLLVDPSDHTALVDAVRRALGNETDRAEWRANVAPALAAYSWGPQKERFQLAILDLLP